MQIDRKFRRDGEEQYPQLAEDDMRFEMEIAALTQDYDRMAYAMLNGIRYVRPYDLAKYFRWDEAPLLREAFGGGRESDKYGNRVR